MGLFKKNKIILNTPRYEVSGYTYYYADNMQSDNPKIIEGEDNKEYVLSRIRSVKAHINSRLNNISYNNGLDDLLDFLRNGVVAFDDPDYEEIHKELKSLLQTNVNDTLKIIECIATYEGYEHKRSIY